MKAILTKHLAFTNTRPSRIKVSAEGVPARIYSKDSLEDFAITEKLPSDQCGLHSLAARRFAKLNNWPDQLVSGQLPNGDWVHCFGVGLEVHKDVVEAKQKLEDGLYVEAIHSV